MVALRKKRVFVTGGAGFIGSHIVDQLISQGNEVTVYDSLHSGHRGFLLEKNRPGDFTFINGDILDFKTLRKSMKGMDFVFHLAAHADVRGGVKNTRVDLEQNTIGTYNVLEAMRLNSVKNILFTSSSTVYGEPEVFPTPEDYPLRQTSMYGASKLAGEALIEAFSEGFGMDAWIFRFSSLIGERYTHGVIFDFVKKLGKNKKRLLILGDGKQKKSYIYVGDCVQAMFTAVERCGSGVHIFNLGHHDFLDVDEMADIIIARLGLKEVEREYTGGKRGWIGDAPTVSLAIDRICALGWEPTLSIKGGVERTVDYLAKHPEILSRE